jgi:hypothetical protein
MAEDPKGSETVSSKGDFQNVVVLNKALSVATPEEPLSVSIVNVTETLKVTGAITGNVTATSDPAKYEYIVEELSSTYQDQGSTQTRNLVAAIQGRLNEGWELSESIVLHGRGSVIIVYRKVRR